VRLDDGSTAVAHTNNTGRMSGCLAPGARVWLSPADDNDPRYGEILRQVAAAGVEIHSLRCRVDTRSIRVMDSLPPDML